MILVFVGIKNTYCFDYQHLACNAKNTHFS